jgi:exodeoxyribonuclease-3
MAKKKNTLKLYTWNVNGIRAVHRKGFMDWFNSANGDIICLQETKCQMDQVPDEIKNIEGYKSYWFCAEKKGYSGVSVFTKTEPLAVVKGLNNPKFDSEGRIIFTEYEKFILANVYFPNGGRGPERVQYKLDFYDELFFILNKKYKRRKGIIITGDFNTAHKEIDVAKPVQWSKSSGFLPIEREWIDKLLNLGYVDVFRKFHTEPNLYTFWDNVTFAREKNMGWRIDFFMVSGDIADKVVAADIHPEVMGSDHCPVSIEMEI